MDTENKEVILFKLSDSQQITNLRTSVFPPLC